MIKRNQHNIFSAVLFTLIIQVCSSTGYAETSSNPGTKPLSTSTGIAGVSASGTVTPDLFTGSMSYSMPIEVPMGRKGMQPNLALTYHSNNGNGWVGVGWDLEVEAIERNTSRGIDYSDTSTDFVLRMSGSAITLVYDSANNIYRANAILAY